MEKPAAIRGTFADFRLIKGRKVAQLVVEIPIEEADAALATLGGLPQPAAERWVALAILKTQPPQAVKQKRKFSELDATMRAGIICGEPAFWRFLSKEYDGNVICEEEAEQWVRDFCGVDSRRGLNDNPPALEKWNRLQDLYITWKREPLYA